MCTLSSYLLQHLYAVRALHLLIVIMQGNIKPHMKYEKMSYEKWIRDLFITTTNNDTVNRLSGNGSIQCIHVY